LTHLTERWVDQVNRRVGYECAECADVVAPRLARGPLQARGPPRLRKVDPSEGREAKASTDA